MAIIICGVIVEYIYSFSLCELLAIHYSTHWVRDRLNIAVQSAHHIVRLSELGKTGAGDVVERPDSKLFECGHAEICETARSRF